MRYMPQHNHTNRFGYQPSAGARTARSRTPLLTGLRRSCRLMPMPRCAAELMARLTPLRRTLLTDLCHPLGVGTRKAVSRHDIIAAIWVAFFSRWQSISLRAGGALEALGDAARGLEGGAGAARLGPVREQIMTK